MAALKTQGTQLFYVSAPTVVTEVAQITGLPNFAGGTNTEIDSIETQSLSGDAQVTVSFQALELVEGTYKVDVAAHKRDGVPYDYHRLLHTFRIKSRTQDVGIYRPRHDWTFEGGVRVTPKR